MEQIVGRDRPGYGIGSPRLEPEHSLSVSPEQLCLYRSRGGGHEKVKDPDSVSDFKRKDCSKTSTTMTTPLVVRVGNS